MHPRGVLGGLLRLRPLLEHVPLDLVERLQHAGQVRVAGELEAMAVGVEEVDRLEERVVGGADDLDARGLEAGLGGERTIRERLSVLSTQGYIKYFRNGKDYGLPSCGRSKFGYLCVEGMVLNMPGDTPDPLTGELPIRAIAVLPTHYKCPQSGAAMPVENPDVWVYQDDITDPKEST